MFDFSGAEQFFCHLDCSPAGPPGCDQEDADMFCRLKLRSKTAHAASFGVHEASSKPGFCCLDGVMLGPFLELGIDVELCYSGQGLSDAHSGGKAIDQIECSE